MGIGGHTHQVENEDHDGIRVLNPGSATGVGPADGMASLLTAVVTNGKVEAAAAVGFLSALLMLIVVSLLSQRG